MAVAACDAVRLACDELRRSAELHDTVVAKAEAEVRARPDDYDAQENAKGAFQEKCRQLGGVLEVNMPIIEEKLKAAREAIENERQELASIEQQNAELKSVKKEIKQQLEEEKLSHDAARLEEATLNNRLAETTKACTAARKAASAYEEKAPFEYHPDQGKLYAQLLQAKLKVLTALESHKVVFAHRNTATKPHGHGYDLQRLEQPDFDKLKEDAATWMAKDLTQLEEDISELERIKKELIDAKWPEEAADIYDALENFNQVKNAANRWTEILEAEDRRRNDMQGTLQKFMKDDAKLLHWCRQERTNMEAQTEPHHVQEFCASLIQNIGTMEENFAHLGDTGEALLPNKLVERALVEVNEVWLNLQVNAYESQRHIMLEIHQKSKLENEVRAFAHFSTKLKRFFEETIKVLQIPTDSESIQVVAPVLSQCRKLLEEFAPHSLLADHLSDFALRMEHIRDNYQVLRQTVFSKLTFLSSDRRTVDEVASQRREEYLSKVAEIDQWLKLHTEGENWESIHTRVRRIQNMIEKQLAGPVEEPAKEEPAPKEEEEEEY
eukprot:TRINITY_DN32351_c0_g1_i1.p1 TRINITY_DN32351_c0_g1~~TRINITY_DN32351_c0_g1_i1.p1  ORF type:complete len:553 (+),score=315.43 TRINITY_DN32351_c0_g1_i1:48-1706(+)